MKKILIILLPLLPLFASSQQIDTIIFRFANGDNIKYLVARGGTGVGTDSIYVQHDGVRTVLSPLDLPVNSATTIALDGKQATLVNQTNLKSINGNSLLGSGDLVLSGTGDLLAANNLSDVANITTAKTNLSIQNVTNESKATMFTSPTFTGTPVVPSTITVGGNAIVFPAVAATLLPNTSTAGVGTSPTATSTVTITHNLGRVPTIIRIYGYGTFTSNAAATATTSSMGIWNSSGNFCVYQRYGAAITTTQAGLSSNAFAVLLATGGGNFISGVIQNVTSTGFDVAFTETGTATAQPYLWEAQQP